MNYTKIVTPNKKWQNIITEDLNTSKKAPCFILAGRFNVFQLKVLSQNHTSDRMIAFIIQGNKKEGQCIVFCIVDLFCDMIIEFSLKKATSFDRELASLLTFALLKRLQEKEVYTVSPALFPNRTKNKMRLR